MEVVLVKVLCFLAVFFLIVGIQAAVRGRRPPVGGATAKPAVFQAFRGEIEAIGVVVEPMANRAFAEDTDRVKNNLIVAALSDRLTVRDLRGAQGLALLTLAVVGGVIIFLLSANFAYAALAAIVLGLLGWVYPTKMWLERMARTRQEQISRALPYAIDLLTVAMQAGQDFGAAVRLFVNEGPKGPLRQEFSILLRQTELGKSRVEALKELDGRVQLPELKSCVSAIVQSTEMGSSVAATLKLQAEEIRRARFHRAERKAARAPSIMLIPIALFILPAVFIVIFTPVILRITSVMSAE